MKIKAIIVEDEKSNRENLAKLLGEYCTNVELVAQCSSAVEGRMAIVKLEPDLVFLDIEMPGGNGFSMLESLSEINFEVIFVTAFNHYGIKAVKFCALDYLLKPIDILELTQAVGKVEKRLSEKSENLRMKTMLRNQQQKMANPKIAIPLSDKIEFVEVSSIISCKGEGNYTHICLNTGETILASKTLKEFDELLGEHNFLRTHQSYLINLNEVKSYIKSDGGYIKMKNGATISISRQRKEMVMEKLKEL